ncbi:TetR/AcrR family transcriptional regulator [Moraxella nasovis]|nr:TetR/AcrR family transcriptional regulator [Moraxella nasovis]
MNKKQQFEQREQSILAAAEQLLLESGEGNLTLDSLACHLDLAKGTLYKHFASKDELLLQIIIEHEKRLFCMNNVDDGAAAGIVRMVLQQLRLPVRAMIFNHIEERLASVSSRLHTQFKELYRIRRKRMTRLSVIAQQYLDEQHSSMTVKDYMSSIWAVGQGGAGLLNSSFYQRYLGDRDALEYTWVDQILSLPRLYPKVDDDALA